MCTAIAHGPLFGRTLDLDCSLGEELILTPRNFPLPLSHLPTQMTHYALLGMGIVQNNFPLYYDGINEHGLAMAGLNFHLSANYAPLCDFEKANLAPHELIPYLLGACRSIEEIKDTLTHIQLVDTAPSPQFPPAKLHWMAADSQQAIVIEPMNGELKVYDAPAGVLTNEPPYPMQMAHLVSFLNLTPERPENRFSSMLSLVPFCKGMGAMGLPGDNSSPSRLVRAAFHNLNSVCSGCPVSQFFHLLDTVFQVRGAVRLGENKYEYTVYSACLDLVNAIYYYTTYENRQITSVSLREFDLDAKLLTSISLQHREQIYHHDTKKEPEI